MGTAKTLHKLNEKPPEIDRQTLSPSCECRASGSIHSGGMSLVEAGPTLGCRIRNPCTNPQLSSGCISADRPGDVRSLPDVVHG